VVLSVVLLTWTPHGSGAHLSALLSPSSLFLLSSPPPLTLHRPPPSSHVPLQLARLAAVLARGGARAVLAGQAAATRRAPAMARARGCPVAAARHSEGLPAHLPVRSSRTSGCHPCVPACARRRATLLLCAAVDPEIVGGGGGATFSPSTGRPQFIVSGEAPFNSLRRELPRPLLTRFQSSPGRFPYRRSSSAELHRHRYSGDPWAAGSGRGASVRGGDLVSGLRCG